jgi:adenylate cyclase
VEPDREALLQQIRDLEGRVAHLTHRWQLNDEVDALSEVAIRDRLPIDHALRLWMPAMCRSVGAEVMFVRTYDETLDLHDFVHAMGEDDTLPFATNTLCDELDVTPKLTRAEGGLTTIARTLDVAGNPFGAVAVVLRRTVGEAEAERTHELLSTWCEEIDNHLASIADARKKAFLTNEMSDALKNPVLDVGLMRALDVLRANVPFEDLLLVFRHEEDVSGDTLRYKILKHGELVHDSATMSETGAARGVGNDVDAFMRSRSFRLMAGDDEEVRERFGIQRYREEVLITGVKTAKVIGRLVVTSRRGEFNTFDRDLLVRFSDSLRQRIVDFNREWKSLAVTFPRAISDRLLSEESYVEKYLSARERECAIMFCDIAGFTRISEQVLGKPEAIGRLIDTWSERVVQIVWETGGTFDKMVGDCVIAIWGPPFFEEPADELCRRAARAAHEIRAFTRSLGAHEALPELVGQEVDVATGLNHCPLMVGFFGPDREYTGFSSGMNNTARLQGQAKGGEILCMDSFVAKVGLSAAFGEAREATVKNVGKPLSFRPLIDVEKLKPGAKE